MSNTIAHLAVAKQILDTHPLLVSNPNAYYLGALAPDTIGSKPGCTREDKKRVHLRQDIRDAEWLNADKIQLFDSRIRQFIRDHIRSASLSARQRDFNTGYLVHLLTDLWNHKTIRQTMLKIANGQGVSESDRDFFHMMTNDLEALDHQLLRKDPDLRRLFLQATDEPVHLGLPGFIEQAYIEGSIRWWKERYLPGIENRKLLYITELEILDFVTTASENIASTLTALLRQD